MNKVISSLAISSLLVSTSVIADSNGMYGYLGFQNTNLDAGDTSVLADVGISVDDSDTGLNLGIGYKVNKYFSIEGGYMNLGTVLSANTPSLTIANAGSDTIDNVPVSWAAGTTLSADAGIDVDCWTLGGLFHLPVTDDFSAYLKAGVYFWDAEASFNGNISAGSVTYDGTTYAGSYTLWSGSEDGTDAYYGIGAQYDINDKFGIRADYTMMEVDTSIGSADLDIWSAAMVVNF